MREFREIVVFAGFALVSTMGHFAMYDKELEIGTRDFNLIIIYANIAPLK